MAEYVQFRAKGVIYNRDKDGKPTTVREIRRGSGVVKTGPEIMGKVFRQCVDLLPCDSVSVTTYNF